MKTERFEDVDPEDWSEAATSQGMSEPLKPKEARKAS